MKNFGGPSLSRLVLGVMVAIAFATLPIANCQTGNGGCFNRVHAKNQAKDADYSFDLKFDRTKSGDSFSCDLQMRASEARKALEAFRFGVLYDSELHIKDAIAFPIVARIYRTRDVTEKPAVIEIRNSAEWMAFKQARFDKLQIAAIACASLRTVEIVKSRTYGFAIGNGMIWFQRAMDSPKVRVTAINLTPVEPGDLVEFCTN